ncbi:ABC transporter substrate-binding protein [Ramlibacter albus]|uniref:ABC transporter substrate-binding protein n=1 Tax=Ramlibacter albus TaxID=2079448 RepID=A0A923MD74_9BURK|nr:ABC transporter substrate-binding protein [Ramlibacter albus]MBC5768213.1 ABC transporter substrate-binding protein [Ramlibacter albus]
MYLPTLALAALLAAPGAFAQARQPFKLAINWFPTGDHGPYFVALDKGYFDKEGLDVAIENSKGSGDSLAKADTGRADVAIADTGVVLAGIARGAKVKIIGMIFDETPQNIFSRVDVPLRTPKDLVGKSIGAPPGDSQRMSWPAFARQNGIDPNSVTWVNIEPTAKVPALATKRVDGVADLLTGGPNYEQAIGADKVVTMPWAKFGFNMYSMAFIASEETLAKKPEQVKAFLRAAYAGWRDVMVDREPSLVIYKKRAPEIEVDYIRKNQAMGIDLMRTARYAQHGLGWIEDKKMCDSAEIANKYMGLAKPVDCKAVFTNAYLPNVKLPLPVKN